jgi:hypothetical protein
MNERPFEPSPIVERRYGEMRCRRYLFDRAFEAEPGAPAASPKAAPAAVRGERARNAERAQ